MNTRILHCGELLENYYLCIEKKVAGFTSLSPVAGDLVYLAVKVDGISYIGARGVIGAATKERPWRNAQNYKHSFVLEHIEFCKPFKIQPLSAFGGTYWAAKYLQASKAIKDLPAVDFLEKEFTTRKTSELQRF